MVCVEWFVYILVTSRPSKRRAAMRSQSALKRIFVCLTWVVYLPLSLGLPTGTCSVLFYADGFGTGHATYGDIPADAWQWNRGSVSTPDGDSALVTSMLSTGCASPVVGGLSMMKTGHNGVAAAKVSEKFSRRGVPYALVSSKCVDDGTASAFTVSWPDRYDKSGVASAISSTRPAPFLLSGGFSRSMWTAAAANSSGYIEFDSEAGSAFAETCEYPETSDFPARTRDALKRVAERGGGVGFFAVLSFAGVDMASHSGKGLDAALRTLRLTLKQTEGFLAKTCSQWKLVLVGSHDTGGCSANGTLEHRSHSTPGTLVPLFTRGVSSRLVGGVKSMSDVARLLQPNIRCSLAPRHDTFDYHGAHSGIRMTTSEVAATHGFVIAIFLLLVFVPCVIFDHPEWHSRSNRR
jgi:hypothetical protein